MPSDRSDTRRAPSFALLAYGFRPFFLLAGAWAIAPMAIVWRVTSSGAWPAAGVTLFEWHGHEMLFGFAAAAVAGFLLTAVPTWTGTRAVSGPWLLSLVALWVLARVVCAPSAAAPNALIALLGVAFFPALAVAVSIPLIRTRNYRNLAFLPILALLFAADLAYQAPRFGWIESSPVDPLRLAINLLLLMVSVVGGRIVPAFTRNALAGSGRPAPVAGSAWLDASALAAVVTVLGIDLVAQDSTAGGLAAFMAAVLLGLRLSRWHGLHTLGMPLLWILHLGFAWLVVGLALKAAWLLGGVGWAMNWVHALTVGAFGTMILAVMTRVALGHTGRPLEVSRPVVAAYLLVTAAAGLRVWGPWLAPGQTLHVLWAAIACWIGGYGLFLLVYAPILSMPRADGKAG
jgi:uncharacterized protein involved in response to NO